MGTTNPKDFTTADAVVEELVRADVEVIYGIVSVHNMPIYDALIRDGRIRLVTARGESGAVNMADGYARVTGKVGVVITSTGAGAGNAAGSLTEAWNAGSPVLHITGEVALDYIGKGQRYIHECKDQLAMMEGASKSAHLLHDAGQSATYMREAIDEALTAPLGPVTVQIPTDLQTQIIDRQHLLTDTVKAHTPDVPEDVIQKIVQAEYPVVWAGGGAIAAEAAEELRKFTENVKPAVITSESGKGAIPEDDPLCIGNFATSEPVVQLLKKADLLFSIGTHFRAEETADWTLPLPANHINIDADPKAADRNYRAACSIIGDAKTVLREINGRLQDHTLSPDPNYTEEIKSIREQVRADLREAVSPYDQFAEGMRSLSPRDAIFVRDVTMPAYIWGNRLIETYEPRTSIFAAGGGIGQALPTAIGAQMADRDRVVICIAGDGGFMENVGELAAAAQEQLPLVVVLFDDGGYGILRYLQSAAYDRQAAIDLTHTDFVKVAESMGFAAEKVGSADAFNTQFETAVAERKPTMIVVDMEAVGPTNQPYEEPEDYIASFRPTK